MNTELNVMQVRNMINEDQVNSKQTGYKNAQYRQETKDAAVKLSEQHQGNMESFAEKLDVPLGTLYTWRYKAGLSNFKKRSSKNTTKKVKPKSPNKDLLQRLKGQVEQHQEDIVKLNKQMELLQLADKLGMKLDFN